MTTWGFHVKLGTLSSFQLQKEGYLMKIILYWNAISNQGIMMKFTFAMTEPDKGMQLPGGIGQGMILE